ncbi:MAG: hypothetical protein KF774_13625 [Planctomyces sp.]|nr:hypothetical protein [Planctomyces sp.]
MGPAFLLALAAAALVLLTSGREAFRGAVAEGPGITLDESFNVETGVYLIRSLREFGLAALHPDSVREIWGAAAYNPDHPPLGRLALGLAHDANVDRESSGIRDSAARPASAIAFALTVWLVAWCGGRWYGRTAGIVGGASVLLMPRQFGHAHLASLETFIGLAYAAAVLAIAETWSVDAEVASRAGGRRPLPGWGNVLGGGALIGLALLTKIQAVFLGPAVAVWALARFGMRGLPRLAACGGMALAVFFAGWPWLWLDPAAHLHEYFARTTERQTLYCFYWGERWADLDVPWHYPWVQFAVVVPLGLQLLGLVGLGTGEDGRSARRDPRLALVLLAVVIPLIVFSLPGIRVYDGERLFAVSFPLWGIVIGRGGARAMAWLRARLSAPAAISIATAFVAAQGWGLARLHPCQLSYYNLAVGGLQGAAGLGFETSYWADSLTESLQRRIVEAVPRGSRIDVAPVLHPIYLDHLLSQSPLLQAAELRLEPYDDKVPGGSRLVLLFHRRADPWESLDPPPEGTEVLARLERAGVPLATLLRLPEGERPAEFP